MEIRRYLSILRRRLILVIAIVAAALVAGWLITPRGDTYTATSTLYIGSRSIDVDPGSRDLSGDRVDGLDRLITTFTELVRTGPIAEAAIEEADVARSPGQVVNRTRAKQVTETNLIRVSFTDRDPVVAQVVANAVTSSFVDQIRDFEPRDTETESEQVVSVYERAGLPSVPNSSGLLRNLVLAGLFGLIVAGGVLALLEYLDITLRSADDVERRLALPVLGVVPALGDELPVTPAVSVRGLPTAAQPTGRTGAPVG
jgi:capsular polysaccharide biosynthesis protein